MLLGPERCLLCAEPGPAVCARCLVEDAAPAVAPPLHVDRCTALLDYHQARPVVTRLKNGDQRSLVGPLAAALAQRVEPPPGAVVTWAPTTSARLVRRGFDQAELLALALGRRWGRPVRPMLRRTSATAQAGRSKGERATTPSFGAVRRAPPSVVVVDDVVTTGATLTAAARALRSAGAVEVVAVALAQAGRAPRPAAG